MRVMFIIHFERPWSEFLRFWEGGIEILGAAIGGWIGYTLAWLTSFRKYHIPTMRLADIIAPAVCVGLVVGRIGCLFNGCCYGKICSADESGYCLNFPLLTAPSKELVVNRGYQTSAGFALVEAAVMTNDQPRVGAIEPGSAAARAGLLRDDTIVRVKSLPATIADQEIDRASQLQHLLAYDWPRGESEIVLTVNRGGQRIELPPFSPRTLRLYPTQLYESISMALLCGLLLTFYPYRRHDGQVFVLLMLGYSVHRLINESLRDDTPAYFLGLTLPLTLSQIMSIGVLAAGVALEIYLRVTSPKLSGSPPVPSQNQAGSQKNAAAIKSPVAPG